MIDIEVIRLQPDMVKEHMRRRGVNAEVIDDLIAVDTEWRELSGEVEKVRAQQKEKSKLISAASPEDRKGLIEEGKSLRETVNDFEQKLEKVVEERTRIWESLPNLLGTEVPDGGEKDAQELRKVPTEIAVPEFALKSYFELGEEVLFDMERATKVSGARFAYLKGDLARLQLALTSFAFDTLREQKFIPILPPVLIGEQAMAGMGYLGAHADEVYKTQDDLYLVGTSEQSIGAMHMNEIVDLQDLPLRYVGYSSCFRREAGSYGKDVRGLIRLHQFDKVEMFSITEADSETSQTEHEFLLQQQESFMQALQLPYRVVALAAQDLGRPSAKTYDIETWIPSEQMYRETHSTSNTTDYQARRLNIRYKKDKQTRKVHMLNGTVFAMSRMMIALMENHQQADGSIAIPEALHPYLPFTSIPAKQLH